MKAQKMEAFEPSSTFIVTNNSHLMEKTSRSILMKEIASWASFKRIVNAACVV